MVRPMKGYLLIILSAVTLGMANISYKFGGKALGPVNSTFFYYLFAFLISLTTWLFFRENHDFILTDLKYPLITAVLLFISVLSFTTGINKVSVSIGSTIRSLSFLFSIIIGVVLLKESLSVKQIAGVLLAVLSLFLLSS